MSSDWWIIPTVALACLAVLLGGVGEQLGARGVAEFARIRGRPRVRPGCFVGALLTLAAAAFVGPVWDGFLRRENRDLCQRHLIQLGLALSLYVQDHAERFPPASAWGDAAEPHLPDLDSFRCPADRRGRRYSYAMNRAVDRRAYTKLPADRVVLLFESDQGVRNASGGERDMAPVSRHNPFHFLGLGLVRPDPAQSGHFFAFGDGHVKWLTPAERKAAGKALWNVP